MDHNIIGMTTQILLVMLLMANLVTGEMNTLDTEEEEEAIRLWHQFCTGDSDHGSEGNTFVFCKRAKQEFIEETVEHTIEVNSRPTEFSRQVVFVQPPSYHYKHNVNINGESVNVPTHNTTIYVLPQKTNHNILYNDTRHSDPAPVKPVLHFLKKDPSSKQDNDNERNITDGVQVQIQSKDQLVHLTPTDSQSGTKRPLIDNEDFFEVK